MTPKTQNTGIRLLLGFVVAHLVGVYVALSVLLSQHQMEVETTWHLPFTVIALSVFGALIILPFSVVCTVALSFALTYLKIRKEGWYPLWGAVCGVATVTLSAYFMPRLVADFGITALVIAAVLGGFGGGAVFAGLLGREA